MEKLKSKYFSRIILLSITIIIALFILKTRWIDGDGKGWNLTVDIDGRGYYAYLPAVFIYQDLYFDFVERNEAALHGKGKADHLYMSNGQRGNKYYIGVALVLTPFFLLAWLISFLTGFDLTGYNMIFYGSVAFASLFYLIVGLIYFRRLLLLYKISETWIGTILLLMVFGTNIFYYSVYEPSISHIYSFSAISAFLFYIKKYQFENKSKQLILASVALAIVTLIRPINILIVFAIPFLIGSSNHLKVFLFSIVKNKKAFVISAISFTSLVFLQSLIYYLTYGSFFRMSYPNEGFDFLHPHFTDALFSYRKGFFIYTPLMLVAVLFIIPYFRVSVFASICYVLFYITIVYFISSWTNWTYGGGFGMRPMVEYYSILIIPLAISLNSISRNVNKLFFLLLFFIITVISLIQTYQYFNHILHYDEMNKDKFWKVFLKTDQRLRVVSFPPKVERISLDSIDSKKIIFNDFEKPEGNIASEMISTLEFYSGKNSVKVDKQFQYSPGYRTTYNDLAKQNISYAVINLMAKIDNLKCDAVLIVSFEWPGGHIYRYDSYPVSILLPDINSWEKTEYSVILPTMHDGDVMNVYVWNPSMYPIFIDDFKVELYTLKY